MEVKLAELVRDRKAFIEATMRVVNEQGDTVPLLLKPAQAAYLASAGRLNLVPKARQLGMTTIGMADDIAEMVLNKNTNVLFAVQSDEDVPLVSGSFKTLYNLMADEITDDDGAIPIKPALVIDRVHLLKFENGSQVLFRTANSIKVGRGLPFHRVHGTEVAFWDDAVAAGLVTAALGASGKIDRFRCTLESTGNGSSGLFYQMCMKPEAWELLFYNWLWEPAYALDTPVADLDEYETKLRESFNVTDTQLAWRRQRLTEFRALGQEEYFRQEFPAYLAECFQTVGVGVYSPEEVAYVRADIREPLSWSHNATTRTWYEPVKGDNYLVIADPSSGTSADPSAAVVLNSKKSQHVATFEGWRDPIEFADDLAELGYYYNLAFIGVERNTGWGEMVLRRLQEVYPNLVYDEKGVLGLHTNMQSKERAVSAYKALLAGKQFTTHDIRIGDQMVTYTRKGRSMGAHGKREHDDILTCVQIGCEVLRSQPWLQSGGQVRMESYI